MSEGNGSTVTRYCKKILLLGSGELGKELVISAKRLGQYVVAVDAYEGAPAMQVADECAVVDMLDGQALEELVKEHNPDIIIPEVEAIRTEKLKEFEAQGRFVVPTAEATRLTMNRDAIRQLAAKELGLKTARYDYATNLEELKRVAGEVGYPCVIKPVMSSSGKGQSTAHSYNDLEVSWQHAIAGARGDRVKVIVEEFIVFDFEITLLTLRQKQGGTLFVQPIGHRQERGDYQESWLPASMTPGQLEKAQNMARAVTDRLGGAGIFGVEFFVSGEEVYFSELSPRPHDTGMVTLISQDLSEFDLHMRAILGLPIPKIEYYKPAATHVVLADRAGSHAPDYTGVSKALAEAGVDVRIFGKPSTRSHRRMAVVLATDASVEGARTKAQRAAESISVL